MLFHWLWRPRREPCQLATEGAVSRQGTDMPGLLNQRLATLIVCRLAITVPLCALAAAMRMSDCAASNDSRKQALVNWNSSSET